MGTPPSGPGWGSTPRSRSVGRLPSSTPLAGSKGTLRGKGPCTEATPPWLKVHVPHAHVVSRSTHTIHPNTQVQTGETDGGAGRLSRLPELSPPP